MEYIEINKIKYTLVNQYKYLGVIIDDQCKLNQQAIAIQ